MATLKASTIILNSSSISRSSSKPNPRGMIRATISLPKLTKRGLVKEFELQSSTNQNHSSPININTIKRDEIDGPDPMVMAKLYAIMEAVADRVEMHRNIGDQRDNWNTLLLASINAITLAAATIAGIASISGGAPAVAMKLSSTAMYVAVTGMLSVVNKIQPSQLAEEQRNAVRLFKQLQNQIQTIISIRNPTDFDVNEMMEKVLALDKAYPLPLLGVMLDKFPATVEPAVWWPGNGRKRLSGPQDYNNGWSVKLEEEMREIIKVVRTKDKEDYLRLGGKALKLNRFLAISGPVMTALAALGSALVGSSSHGGWAVVLAVGGGALASVVNTVEHGGQVGMVFEMYRSNAGFFKLMEESIGSNLREEELERRENGEVLELKVGLQLGRSLSQLRDLAAAAAAASVKGGGGDIDEFASKLF